MRNYVSDKQTDRQSTSAGLELRFAAKNLDKFFRKLTIDNSDLGMIQPKALSGMLGVQELSIINSKIDKVGGNILSAESQVKSVKLEGNHLLAIPAEFDYMVRIYIGCPKKMSTCLEGLILGVILDQLLVVFLNCLLLGLKEVLKYCDYLKGGLRKRFKVALTPKFIVLILRIRTLQLVLGSGSGSGYVRLFEIEN